MDYPKTLKLGTLQSENAEFSQVHPHLQKISLLCDGGYRLRDSLDLFIKKRHGEEPAIYNARLQKYAYSNVLGSAIAQLATKFSNGSIYVEGAQPDSFWDDFREDNNGQGRTENQLVNQLLSQLLPFKSVFVHVDKPASDVEPLNAAQEAMLGLMPKVVLYSALQVPAWSEADGQLQWVKVFQVTEDNSDPTRKPIMRATWTFIDGEAIAKYSAFVKMRGDRIVDILDAQGKAIAIADEETEINLQGDPIIHGFGRIPVTRVMVPDAMWSGNQAYSKAEESLLLECYRTDYLTATYPQRTFKRVQTPDDDLENTYADSSVVPLPTGLEYVLELDSFTWNEPTGAILDQVRQSLEQAAKDIKSILAIGGAYVQDGGATAASGESKKMDFEIEENRLEAYGHVVTDALQDVYQLVAIAIGQSPDSIAVSGLDDFGRERLNDLIQSLVALLTVNMGQLEATLTPTLYQLVRAKLMGFLMGNLTPEQKQVIEDELLLPAETPAIAPTPTES